MKRGEGVAGAHHCSCHCQACPTLSGCQRPALLALYFELVRELCEIQPPSRPELTSRQLQAGFAKSLLKVLRGENTGAPSDARD